MKTGNQYTILENPRYDSKIMTAQRTLCSPTNLTGFECLSPSKLLEIAFP